MTMTTTTLDAALKQIYQDKNYQQTTYRKRPLFAMLSKDEKFGGRNKPIVNEYTNPMGRSATFATAQTNSASALITDFLLTRVSDYAVADIESEAIEASTEDMFSFVKGLKTQVDGALRALADATEGALFRSGTGSIGQVASGEATDTITLVDLDEAANFEVGMVVRGTSTDGGAYDTGQETVEAVNRSAGQLTATSAAWNTVMTALAANDYLVVSGDGANGSTNIKITGLEGWMPSTRPTSGDSFFGVDRSVDDRLAGCRHDGSASLIEEALIDGQSKSAQLDGAPDACFVNHSKYRALVKELGSKVSYEKRVAKSPSGDFAKIGFRTIVVDGDNGPMNIVSANKCPSTVAWALDMATWALHTLGPAGKLIVHDGLRIRAAAAADSFQVRAVCRGNLASTAPGWSCRITLPA